MTEPKTPPTPDNALEELQADNGRRLQALAKKGLPIGGLDNIYLATLMEHLVVLVANVGEVVQAKLDAAGRVSHLLDSAEKEMEKERVQSRILHPGQMPPVMPPFPEGTFRFPGRNEKQ
jgi:hypothetical protein